MRWPWQKTERRSYANIIADALEAAVASQTATTAATAAVEAVGGMAARMIAHANVNGPSWARDAITADWRAQAVRELFRQGEHLSVIAMSGSGRVELHPAADWDWWGCSLSEDDWMVRATLYGPHTTFSREVSRNQVVALRWARTGADQARGRGPLSLASLTAKTAAETERALGDEAAGALSMLLAVPEGHDGGDSSLASIRTTIAKQRGKTLLLETTAGGFGDRQGAPQRDWKPARLGPEPPASVVQAARESFARMCGACGASPDLFDFADGTGKREAARQFFLATVRPLAAVIGQELSRRLEADISLDMEPYFSDMSGRTQSFQRLVQGGMDIERAARLSGVLVADG